MPFTVRPRTILLAAVCATAAPAFAAEPSPAPQDLMLLNRITWGQTAQDADRMSALGRRRWLDQQLHPGPGDHLPAAVQAEIDALPISTTPMPVLIQQMEGQREAYAKIADPEQKKAAQEAYKQAIAELARQGMERSLLRDVYSPDQLKQQMTWFWTNHFNVFARKRDIRAMISDYEEAAIRPHALGKFRDLLDATLRHPAMLRYLDNDQNASGRINENYAREIMELHTMGVGSGYTQKDVQELARILTGVGVDLNPATPKLKPAYQGLYLRDGLFEFNPNRHDFGDKVFLGHKIKGSGFHEVEQALDILSRQPATAHHVSLQLAQYFVGDNPPPALVGRMAASFQRSDGDIPTVLQTLFASREFAASLGTEFKDPMHYVVSAVRVTYGERLILNGQPMRNWLNALAEGLYNHETPDGYPMGAAAWNGPGQMATRFEIARQIGSGAQALFRPAGTPPPERPIPLEPQALLYRASLDQTLGEPTRTALAKASTPQVWSTLYLSSPEFMRR